MKWSSMESSARDDRPGLAWDNRTGLADLSPLGPTLSGVLFEPRESFRQMRRDDGIGEPIVFATLVNLLLGFGLFALGRLGVGDQVLIEEGALVVAWVLGAMVVGWTIHAPLVHTALRVTRSTSLPFRTTLRTYCYVQGSTALLGVVPYVGEHLQGGSFILWLVVGLSATHDIGLMRTIVAAFLLPFAFVLTIVLSIHFLG